MTAIIADRIGKSFRRYERPIDSLKEMLLRRPYHQSFEALADVSFRLEYGETLGVIGDNGAGKSTLLKLLAGALKITSGSLHIDGRVSAILELGTGFHPEFTGLENAKLGCSLLGLGAPEIEQRLQEIIEFSELGDFLYQPVKTYSSGMYVRLAFSIVTSIDPDILIVDEALAVGDQHFQKKSLDRMMAFRDQGRALVFCSHALYQVRQICDRAIWIDRGRIRHAGPVEEVVDAYQDYVRQLDSERPCKAPEREASSPEPFFPRQSDGAPRVYFEEIRWEVPPREEEGLPIFGTFDEFRLYLSVIAEGVDHDDVNVGVVIKRNDGIQCFGMSTEASGISLNSLGENRLAIVYCIPSLSLLSGEYLLDLWLIDGSGVHVYESRESCFPFRVRQEIKAVGVNWMEHEWVAP